jgi:peptidoglycan biosynthesis protein MviN/MurJ (putative lipid II flippase)
MLAFLFFASSQMQWFTSAILLSACNRQNAVFICTVIASVPGFVLGYVLARRFGLPGFVYGLAIADALGCGVILPWKACRLIGESVVRFFSEVTLRHLLLLAVMYTAMVFIHPLLLRSTGGPIEQMIATGLVVGVLGCSSAYVFLLNHLERNHLNSILVKMFSAR